MIKLFRSISGKLYALVKFFSFSFVVMLAYQLQTLEWNLDDFKRSEIKSMVEASQNIAARHYQMFKDGHLSENEAKARAKEALGGMRYQSKNYVFVFDYAGTNLVHPLKPDFEGTNKFNAQDGKGKLYIQEFIDVARSDGGGFVDYVWKNPSGELFTKLSYIKGFQPWG